MTSEIAGFIAAAEEQIEEVQGLVREFGRAGFRWRPAPKRWSVGEHLAHMSQTIRPYLPGIRRETHQAREAGWTSPGPYRYTRFGVWFARAMEPPPRLRVPTLRSLVPPHGLPKQSVLAEFEVVQRDLIEAMESADGVDLGRATIRSPFARLVKLRLGEAFMTILAHNRRHLWLAREVMSHPEFPPSE